MNGVTVVSFYNKSRSFTYQEFQNGTLQALVRRKLGMVASIIPLFNSYNLMLTNTTTQTQETVNQATEAATNATNIANQVNVP